MKEVTSKASGAANDVWSRLTNNLHNASTNAVYYGLAMKLKDPRVAEGPEWFLGSLDEDERMVVVTLVGASMLELQARAVEIIGRACN